MTDPRTLTAVAHAWSLRRAWAALADTNQPEDRLPLRSPTYGTIRATGGHGDPVADRAAAATHTTTLTDRVREHVDLAWWLVASATRHRPPATGPRLSAITLALPDVDPATAHQAGGHLADADQVIRRHLRLGDDHLTLTNPPCPACQQRLLRARTSNPDTSGWVIICGAGCQCAGPGCPCGMTTPVPRVTHIWSAAHPIARQAHTALVPA